MRIPPLPESEATDKAAQTYERLREMLGVDSVPEAFLSLGRAEALLGDFYMNFKKFIWKDGKLDRRTKLLIALAVALKEGNGVWADCYTELASAEGVTEAEVTDVAALVATNATYNTFFKFRTLSGTDLFDGLPVGLRAHAFQTTAFDDKTVELINTAVSDLNACEPCVAGHVKKARALGLEPEAILEAIQVTSVAYSGVQFTKSAKS
ncbi:carboxymuconolactone decarboxylase family protein [Alienimonas chondri]|uniref:Alkyl hydroperoxide reductase AhpD n=1 Tax=Alienimonas chondri TaxID=2681879 RepID=A0ABX1VAF7_9PLAN|nr:carboxymuconolactone decarboxylase family protein [Alienimonas chondri]NNJ25075.1 Alkyl hydroperoxide reductase AhpD [Alienimonas chondri]